MWTYHQSTGKLFEDGHAMALTTCYSGFGPGKNNPEMEAVHDVGPIPCGKWKITGVFDSPRTGPFSIVLVPVGHDAHGRSDFRIHGDSKSHPGEASHGCIITLRLARELVMAEHYEGAGREYDIEVVP